MATSVPGMTSPDVLVRVATARGVTTLTLDSPHNRNALSTGLMTSCWPGWATRSPTRRFE